jgi:hypothetical protein
LVGQAFGDLADEPLGRHAQPLVRAFLGRARPHHLVVGRVVEQHPHEFGNALVFVGHVGVGPHDDLAASLLRADAPRRAGAAIAPEGHQPDIGITLGGTLQHLERVVGRGVVDA